VIALRFVGRAFGVPRNRPVSGIPNIVRHEPTTIADDHTRDGRHEIFPRLDIALLKVQDDRVVVDELTGGLPHETQASDRGGARED
jgi:hypothetical protein